MHINQSKYNYFTSIHQNCPRYFWHLQNMHYTKVLLPVGLHPCAFPLLKNILNVYLDTLDSKLIEQNWYLAQFRVLYNSGFKDDRMKNGKLLSVPVIESIQKMPPPSLTSIRIYPLCGATSLPLCHVCLILIK